MAGKREAEGWLEKTTAHSKGGHADTQRTHSETGVHEHALCSLRNLLNVERARGGVEWDPLSELRMQAGG